MGPVRIFIGHDEKEEVAYHVLRHSIERRASEPVPITALIRSQIRDPFARPRDKLASTDFSDTRFLVPWLCDYQGYAIFVDCDMLCRTNILGLMLPAGMNRYAVAVRKHDHRPAEGTKFLGQAQTTYPKKNWSSLMVFNNAMCRTLTPGYVNEASGLDLHQFNWLEDDSLILGLEDRWNVLVGYEPYRDDAGLVHFTEGTPCFPEYREQPYADEWFRELYHLQHYEGRDNDD